MREPTVRELRRLVSQAICFTLILQTGSLPVLAMERAPEPRASAARPAPVEPAHRRAEASTEPTPTKPPTPAPTPAAPPRSLLLDRPQPAPEAGEAPAPKAARRTSSTPPSLPPKLSARLGGRSPAGSTVAPALTAAGEVPLLPGVNLVSLPAEPADPSPSAVVAPIAPAVAAIYAYDACDAADPWKVYDPADPSGSDLAALEVTQGLWVDATAAAALPVPGTPPPTTALHLCAGWNLVGYPLAEARPALSALASIAPVLERVYGFDPSDPADPWEVFDPAVPGWASDLERMEPGRGYWVRVSADADLTYANQGPPPAVAFAVPADLGTVTGVTGVEGTVSSNLLSGWTLGVRPSGTGAVFSEIASGATPVSAGRLGSFDPTLLENGLYDLELRATDFAGQVSAATISVLVDGGQKVGPFTLSFADLEVPVSGLPIRVVRTFDSRVKTAGAFGVGWRLAVSSGTYRNNRPPGEGWQILGGTLPCQAAGETLSHRTTVRLSDRELYRFRPTLAHPAVVAGGCVAEAGFAFVDGPVPGARLEILGNASVLYRNGGNEVVDADTFELYEPRRVRLTTRDGRVFDLDLAAGVTRVADPDGNELSITASGITHSSGKAIRFTRDGEGRITRVTDPLGASLTYGYDAAGDLVAVSDRAGETTRFTYDARHDLRSIEDPRGLQPIRNDYDAEGRLVRHTDAFGKTIELAHDLAGRSEVVTNRLGASRVLEYDPRGNVVREVDETGGVTLRTFDARDHLLSETDPLGHTTTYTYADDNPTSVTDPLGGVTTTTYDASGRPLTVTDPRGGVTRNVYDAAGHLLSTTDPLGNETAFTYDGHGNVVTETDPGGGVTRSEYDGSGNLLRRVDPLGHEMTYAYDANGNRRSQATSRTRADGTVETLTTTFAYDALGREVSTTDPAGGTSSTTYDPLGQVATTTDALGRVTGFAYDEMGRLVATTYPDGTAERRTYDAEGRMLTRVDRAGRLTRFAYEAAGRLLSTTFADGSTTRNTYDAAGRLTRSTDARGNATTYAYDAAGRRTGVTDALGHSTVFAYDAAGNQVEVTDARGNVTRFEYDAASRLVATVFPDGTRRTTAYDKVGRRVAETDPAGNTTRFAYDALGRLLSVTDALGQVTGYTYDELGNRLTQTDAAGHTTRFAYDRLGRLESRTLPAVAPSPTGAGETLAYDAVGNLVAKTTFGGATIGYRYDAVNRLVGKAFPDGTGVTFTYTPTGRRATATDGRGTTSYAYDARDRLTALTDPDGRALLATYDAQGNRTALSAVAGGTTRTTTSSYDALDRLETVTDPDGRIYRLAYDAVGNRAGVAYPNGVETTYAYDPENRLTSLVTRGGGGAVLQSYAYALGPAGNRTAIDEADGTRRAYTYDALFRLTGERVTTAGALVYENAFAYDPVGNRLGVTRTAADGTATEVPSTYDERDRLRTQDGTTFSWDADGRLTARSGADGARYTWDVEDRLVRVEKADGTVVTHAYDADGNRVRTEVTPATGPPRVTSYLVDTSGPLSQVVAETDGDGALQATYVRGDDLLAVLRPGQGPRFYHADGLGSIRLLTDETGAVTDRYDFSAFGELLGHTGDDPNGYLFAGEALDLNSGFYYLRARWMDPGVGRFLSVDPWAGILADPTTLHRYLYGRANPSNKVDPTGRFSPSFNLTVAALAVATVLALGFIWLNRPLFNTIPIRIRPVIASGSGWTKEAVTTHLLAARTIFQRQATNLLLEWGSIEVKDLGHQDSIALADALKTVGSVHRPGFVTLVYMGVIRDDLSTAKSDLALGGVALPIGGVCLGATVRGAAISRLSIDKPGVTGHELAHAIGCLPDRGTPGAPGHRSLLMYYLWQGGTSLDPSEVEQLRRWGRRIP